MVKPTFCPANEASQRSQPTTTCPPNFANEASQRQPAHRTLPTMPANDNLPTELCQRCQPTKPANEPSRRHPAPDNLRPKTPSPRSLLRRSCPLPPRGGGGLVKPTFCPDSKAPKKQAPPTGGRKRGTSARGGATLGDSGPEAVPLLSDRRERKGGGRRGGRIKPPREGGEERGGGAMAYAAWRRKPAHRHRTTKRHVK